MGGPVELLEGLKCFFLAVGKEETGGFGVLSEAGDAGVFGDRGPLAVWLFLGDEEEDGVRSDVDDGLDHGGESTFGGRIGLKRAWCLVWTS